MASFWNHLPRPFFALAPMADVTDIAFRTVVSECSRRGKVDGGPDVLWTEFVSADGLASRGREALLPDLVRGDNERPIVAQIFGSNPENIKSAASLVRELGFDGVDINMGCPDRSVEKQGAGAALIRTPSQALEIIAAAKEGAGDIPVSVKTRVGYNAPDIDGWIGALLEAKPAAITVHARTRKEMSLVPARWEHVADVVEMVKSTDTVIIGNGDVASIGDGLERAAASGAHGIMVGRGIFGNPWFFDRSRNAADISLSERLQTLSRHTRLFAQLCTHKNYAVMKKHFGAYVVGFAGAKELRARLMDTSGSGEAVAIIDTFLSSKGLV